ncbi:MAG: hypothetical protein JWO80_536 [Bryobacterales bacterium]|nr:hypothetical protein [Bryobacterales bacterium]
MLCFRCIVGVGPWLCRLKNLFQFAQGLRDREPWLAYPGFAARSNVQHPERHFQNPTSLDLFQAAIRHRLATFYETGMQPHCPAMPWMPGIADFTTISNMGVVLLSCTILNGTTRARTISSCSPLRTYRRSAGQCAAVIDSAACLSFTPESRDSLTTRGNPTLVTCGELKRLQVGTQELANRLKGLGSNSEVDRF